MATTDLGACEWFVWDLRRSNLIDRGQLDQIVNEFLKKRPRAEPPELAEFLVSQQILTPFQSERILQGKTQGLVLGPYTLMDAIGAGSMGTVYKAISKTDNSLYAVKVLPRRSMWNVRLARRQVRAFEQFQNPAVVPFVDVGTSGGLHYLSWPLVEDGEPLDHIVQSQGKLTPEIAALYCMQTAQGMAVCHQHGIFHGLLKPSNILVGTDHQVHILDFGIGSLLAENEGESLVDTMSTANTLTSGLDCASPESIMEPTNRTPAGDQYSLGCVLYFCLTGRYPFPEGSAVEKMMAHQAKKPAPIHDFNPDVPQPLIAVVDRLMEKAPEDRYPGMEEAAEALKPFAPNVPPSRLPPRRPGPARTAVSSSSFGGGFDAQPMPDSRPVPEPRGPVLPTRQSLMGDGGANEAPTRPVIPEVPPAHMVMGEAQGKSWEERLGPVGIVAIALMLIVAAWFAATRLF
ncbi:MAG: serine/threonine protein kinase [Gemmataceae bacterium]